MSSRLLRLVPVIAAVALIAPQALHSQNPFLWYDGEDNTHGIPMAPFWTNMGGLGGMGGGVDWPGAESVTWIVCTPGALSACASAQLTTAPLYDGSNRVGTAVSIIMANLNGRSTGPNPIQQIANDNTLWSQLSFFDFHSSAGPDLGTNLFLSLPMYPYMEGGTVSQFIAGVDMQDVLGGTPDPLAMLVGCGLTPFGLGFETCGGFAEVDPFAIGGANFDASSFDGVSVAFNAAADQSGFVESLYCNAGSAAGGADPQCNVLSSVTPEPVTMSLVATGLIGLAGIRWRRRKRPLG